VLGADWWRFDVIADATGTLSYIGSVQVPTSWGEISGGYALAFSEWFTNPGITSCLQVPRVTTFFGTPGYSDVLGDTANATSVTAETATVTAAAQPATVTGGAATPIAQTAAVTATAVDPTTNPAPTVGGLAMGGGYPYLGYPGSLMQLPSPAPGYEPVDIVRGATHELLSGGNVRDRVGVRRRFTLNWPAATDSSYQLLRSLTRLPGPYRYMDPLEANLLTVNQSNGSDETRTTEGAMARFQGTLTSSTAQFRSWSRSFAWNSVTALSISGRGIYLYNDEFTVDASWAAVRPNVQYTASGYLRATSAVSFQAGIDWMTAAGTFISVSLGTGAAVSTANFNTRFTVTATAPSNAAYGIPFFINTSTPGTILTVYADELQFEEGAAASSFRLGVGTPQVSVDSLGHNVLLADATVGFALHEVELVLLEL
jgi:hypothetical protein